MAGTNGVSKVGALEVRKSSKGEKNKGVDFAARCQMKLKLFFCCIVLGSKEKGCLGNKKKKNGSGSLNDKGKTKVAELSEYPNFRKFSYNDLRLATRNFSRGNFLGEGGFGSVFKGWLSDDELSPTKPGVGKPVAVKTLNQDGLQGHTEWLAELDYLNQLQHPKFVQLIGFCIEGEKRLIVYEFMAQGSLDAHLFRSSVSFPWSIRMRIMLDAAEGLAYLHEKAVIFRDFKTSNVLLDMDFNAKLSDFGFAKDEPLEGDEIHVSSIVMGTRGYLAPEYLMGGRLSTKIDVYSFGVVLLEIITGRTAVDHLRPVGEKNLVSWVLRQIKDGGRLCYMVVVDPRLHGQYPKRSALKALKLAKRCVSPHPALRPHMSEVVQELKNLPSMDDDMAHL